ncbi:hypothetical protein, partial [Olivibacter domesticus]
MGRAAHPMTEVREEEARKILKKYFGKAEKISTFAAPQGETGGAMPMGMKEKRVSCSDVTG